MIFILYKHTLQTSEDISVCYIQGNSHEFRNNKVPNAESPYPSHKHPVIQQIHFKDNSKDSWG